MKWIKYSKTVVTILIFSLSCSVFAQKQSDMDLLYWSAKDRMALDDFGIQSTDSTTGLSSATFSLEYNVNGLSFLTKNFNKKVSHYMVRSASQITIDENTDRYIRYQQALFDIQEIYVRKFRKALRENKSKLLLSTTVADELKDKIIGVDLPNRQADYNNETNMGKSSFKQREWEIKIKKELSSLKDFAYDK